MKNIGFIGMGNMAEAIVEGLIKTKTCRPENIYGYDINQESLIEKAQRLRFNPLSDLVSLIKETDLIFLAVKPNVIEGLLFEIKDDLHNKTVVSLVTGYDFLKLNNLLDKSTHHLTIMPNTPALIGEGMTILEKEHSLDSSEYHTVATLIAGFGKTVVLPAEQFKVATAISGCGPAFVYMMIEALADGAVLGGMNRELAYQLASQTLIGSGKMVQETGKHPGLLKDQVCSPGGVTIRGVEALEENGFRNALIKAVKAANNEIK